MIGWFVSKLMSVSLSNKEGVKSMLALIDIRDAWLCITCIVWKHCGKGRKYWLAAFSPFSTILNTLCR